MTIAYPINTSSTHVYYNASPSTPAATELKPILSVSFPKHKVSDIVCTSLTDVAKRTIPGIEENDKVSFKIAHSNTNWTILNGLFGQMASWKIVLSDGAGYSFEGYLCEMDSTEEPDKLVEWSCSVSVSAIISVSPALVEVDPS